MVFMHKINSVFAAPLTQQTSAIDIIIAEQSSVLCNFHIKSLFDSFWVVRFYYVFTLWKGMKIRHYVITVLSIYLQK